MPAVELISVAVPPIVVALVLIVPAVERIVLARPSIDRADVLIVRARLSTFVSVPFSGVAVSRIDCAILLVCTNWPIASVDSLMPIPVSRMFLAFLSIDRAVLTVSASSPAAITTDAATRTKMMMLTPCTPPEAPVARPPPPPPPPALADCCWGLFGFLFSAGTEHSAGMAPMRLAL